MSDINAQDQIQDDAVRREPGAPVADPIVDRDAVVAGPIAPDAVVADPVVVSPPEVAEPESRRLPHTRVGAAWVGLCALAIVAIAFIIFMLQNTDRVQVRFLGTHASLPLAVALLIAAVAGVLVVLCVGTIRITQLRRMARRTNGTGRRFRRPV